MSHNVDWETFAGLVTVKKYSIVLQSNPYVPPFTAQHSIDLTTDAALYGQPISSNASGGSGEGIPSYIDPATKRVYVTGMAEHPKATVYVTFIRTDIVQVIE